MNYELFEELKLHIENVAEENKDPKEVIKTLVNLIEPVAEFYMEDKS
ncbi:hypothetical protein [Bacillus sp. 103mf]|nr:hypothetical protein [Bacillus sp. 103mf]